jgi:hypothetical protein
MLGAFLASCVGSSPSVTLSGASINDTDGVSATAGIRFNSDGTIDKNEGGVYSQIGSTTDWIIPNGAASADYDVRYTTAASPNDFTAKAAAQNTWIDLGANREWSLTLSSPDTHLTGDITFEIRNPGGVTVATGVYSFTATVV